MIFFYEFLFVVVAIVAVLIGEAWSRLAASIFLAVFFALSVVGYASFGARMAVEGRRRPCHGSFERFADDPHWRDQVLFYEYFDGDTGRGLGASHQTGWTALVATLIDQCASRSGR